MVVVKRKRGVSVVILLSLEMDGCVGLLDIVLGLGLCYAWEKEEGNLRRLVI